MKAMGKIAFVIAALMLAITPALLAADSTVVLPSTSDIVEADTLTKALAIATGVYEVVTRVIPTSKDITLVGNILKLISFVSNLFNRKKKTSR